MLVGSAYQFTPIEKYDGLIKYKNMPPWKYFRVPKESSSVLSSFRSSVVKTSYNGLVFEVRNISRFPKIQIVITAALFGTYKPQVLFLSSFRQGSTSS